MNKRAEKGPNDRFVCGLHGIIFCGDGPDRVPCDICVHMERTKALETFVRSVAFESFASTTGSPAHAYGEIKKAARELVDSIEVVK